MKWSEAIKHRDKLREEKPDELHIISPFVEGDGYISGNDWLVLSYKKRPQEEGRPVTYGEIDK